MQKAKGAEQDLGLIRAKSNPATLTHRENWGKRNQFLQDSKKKLLNFKKEKVILKTRKNQKKADSQVSLERLLAESRQRNDWKEFRMTQAIRASGQAS